MCEAISRLFVDPLDIKMLYHSHGKYDEIQDDEALRKPPLPFTYYHRYLL